MAYKPTGRPTGRPRGGKYSPRAIGSIEEQARAIELRKAGLSYREIGQRMGIHPTAALRKVEKGLRHVIGQNAEVVRAVQYERLEKQYSRALLRLQRAEQADDHDQVNDLHHLLLKIDTAIAKNQGLYETKISLRAEIHNRERMDVIAVAIAKDDGLNTSYHALLERCISHAGNPGGYGVYRNGSELPGSEAPAVVELSPHEGGGWEMPAPDRDDAPGAREEHAELEALPGVVPGPVADEEGRDRQP